MATHERYLELAGLLALARSSCTQLDEIEACVLATVAAERDTPAGAAVRAAVNFHHDADRMLRELEEVRI